MANTPDAKPTNPAASSPAVPAATIFPASTSTNQPVPTSDQLAATYSLSDAKPNAPSELDWTGNEAGASRTVASKVNSDQLGSTGKRLTKNSA
ncbi:MAG: hypothetical protein FD138_4342, partial [Planctomycetota bacterium]